MQQNTISQSAAAEPTSVRVAGIVLKWLRGDKDANMERAEVLIREAAANGAKIVATSECFLDGLMAEDNTLPLKLFRSLAEPVPNGPYCCRLGRLAAELGIYLVAGMIEHSGPHCYNSAVVFGPDGKHIGTYRKENLTPKDALRSKAGDGTSVFATRYGRMGLRICFDRTSPELVRATCEAGADFVLLICGGIYGMDNTKIVQARARETGKPMIFVHPVHFVVAGPDGTILADAQFGGAGKWPMDIQFSFPLLSVHSALRGAVIGTEQIGTEIDRNGVGYYDLPLCSLAAEGTCMPAVH